MPGFGGTFDLSAIIETIRSIIESFIEQLRTLVSDIRIGNEPGAPVNPQ